MEKLVTWCTGLFAVKMNLPCMVEVEKEVVGGLALEGMMNHDDGLTCH